MIGAGTRASSTRAAASDPFAGGAQGSRLLLLSEHFYPTTATCGRLLTALSEDLVAGGLEVSVLTSFSPHGGQESRRSRQSYRGISITRVPTLRLPREKVLGRLINEISLTLLIFLVALTRPNLERILVTSSPPFLAPAAALVAALRRVPLIYLVMDVYPDMAVATGHLQKESLAYRAWNRLSRFAIVRADQVVVLGRCMREVIRAKAGEKSPPIEVLPNWADGEEIFPLPRHSNRFLASHPELRNRFVLQYSGNLGRFHDFETILSAAERLAQRNDIRFVIIGKGARQRWLAEQIEARSLHNVLLLPYQPQGELNHSLNAQSASLVTLEPGTEGLCVPSKFYPVLAAGKPVIAVMDRRAEVARVVEDEGVGLVVPQRDADGLVSAVERLSSSPGLCSVLGGRARALQQSKFDRRQATARYLSLINAIPAKPRQLSGGDTQAA